MIVTAHATSARKITAKIGSPWDITKQRLGDRLAFGYPPGLILHRGAFLKLREKTG